jgi:hypothetical protein
MLTAPLSLLTFPVLRRPFYLPLAVMLAFTVLALSLTPAAEGFFARVVLFYGGVSLAYALMPYVRRGDIPLVAAWVVLASALAPCIHGELISPVKVTADVLGVAMAAGPIFVARMRQVLQGDLRDYTRPGAGADRR